MSINKSDSATTKENREIEVRFLDIDQDALTETLLHLGAEKVREGLLKEAIFYDADLKWKEENRFLRVRSDEGTGVTTITYKHNLENTADGTEEVEITCNSFDTTCLLFQKIGLQLFRKQEKLRSSYHLDSCSIEIDTWPSIPTYVEIEAPSITALEAVAGRLELSMENANTHNAAWVIENVYNVPVRTLSSFTFEDIS
jgi:adenylate cyclase class 2